MSLIPKIESLCKAAVLTDPSDLQALAAMHDQLTSLEEELSASDLDSIAECVERASRLVEQIVLRETQDEQAALDLVRRGIEYAQNAVLAEQRGQTLSEIGPSPFSHDGAAPANEINTDLLASWLNECGKTLDGLVATARGAASGDDTQSAAADARRHLHTLKGECGVIPLHTAQHLCGAAEAALDRCADTGTPFPTELVLGVADWMIRYTNALRNDPAAAAPEHTHLAANLGEVAPRPTSGEIKSLIATTATTLPATQDDPQTDEGDPTPVTFPADADTGTMLAEFLTESREHLANAEQALLQLEKQPEDLELINTVFRAFHTIKGVAGFMNLKPIVSLAHEGECLLDAARSGNLKLDSGNLDLILKACDLLSQLLAALEGGTAPTTGRFNNLVHRLGRAVKGESAASQPSTPGVSASTTSSSRAASQPNETPAATNTNSGAPSISTDTTAKNTATANTNSKSTDQTVKVSTGRMDTLVDLVGELVIAQQMVVQDPAIRTKTDQRLQRNLSMVGKIIRDLQAVSMSLRMVPIKATFQKMARLVRDVSAKAGKQILLHTEGEDVELDRNVVEVIADPLVHMVRNASDHGVETPEARRAAGKPESGNIWLRAYHSGGSIVVEIEDDGKGLSREKIVAKAIEKGIYTPDRPVADIPDAEVFNLIFLPGFSTADKVTDISGRGVGMDVVRRNIEALRGKIDIRSTAGKGTVFSMRLPLTMAIIDGMVVRVGSQRYVIPTLSIERSFRPQPKDLHSVVGKGEMAMVRGGLLPIYRLHQVLGHDTNGQTSSGDLLIVVESQDTRACLAADEIIGQQQVVIKTLGQATQAIRGVSGGAILGDGRVALILDIGGILKEATAAA
ncbi:MAG: Hpt domain-containing protein [Planctomycetes bacterium]|nr:Hpt domain-containing protein [Planctomycetota bacterium]